MQCVTHILTLLAMYTFVVLYLYTRICYIFRVNNSEDGEGGEPVVDTFWERNFGEDDSVPWYKFQTTFLTEYDSQLRGQSKL